MPPSPDSNSQAPETPTGETGLPVSFEEIMAKAFAGEIDSAPADTVVEESEQIPSGESPDEILALEEKSEEEAPEAEEAEQEAQKEPQKDARPLEETPAFNQLGKRAQSRIQELNAERKEVTSRLEAIERQAQAREQQYANYVQQLQAYTQAQLAQMQAALESAQVHKAELAREESELSELEKRDPVEAFRRKTVLAAKQEAKAEAAARVAEIERQLQERDRKAQAQAKATQREAEKQKRFTAWDAQLREVVPKTILRGAAPEKQKALYDQAANFLLAYAASGAQEPAEAVKEFDQIIDQLAEIRAAEKAKARGAVVAKNKQLPGGGSGAKSAAAAGEALTPQVVPSKAELAAAGYGTLWEYRRAGSPPIRKQA